MCNKTVDYFLPALKFIPDWFGASKMIKTFLNALLADDNILFFDKNSGNDIFSSNEIGILSVDLDNINLDGVNFDEDYSETIIHVRLMTFMRYI